MKKIKIFTTITLSTILLGVNTITPNAEMVDSKISKKPVIETRALDGKINMREYLTSAYTSGDTTQRVSVLIRYSEYVSPSARYITQIHNVYVYGGDYTAATFEMTNGYPINSGLNTSTAKISCHGTLQYVSENLPYSHKVRFTGQLPVGAGSIIK